MGEKKKSYILSLTVAALARSPTGHKSPLFHQESQVGGTFGTRHELDLDVHPRGTFLEYFDTRQKFLSSYGSKREILM